MIVQLQKNVYPSPHGRSMEILRGAGSQMPMKDLKGKTSIKLHLNWVFQTCRVGGCESNTFCRRVVNNLQNKTLRYFCFCLFSEQFKKMYVQKVKEQEKAYNKQVCTQRRLSIILNVCHIGEVHLMGSLKYSYI